MFCSQTEKTIQSITIKVIFKKLTNFTGKHKKTDKSISTVTFTSDDIATLIQNLDPNKAWP